MFTEIKKCSLMFILLIIQMSVYTTVTILTLQIIIIDIGTLCHFKFTEKWAELTETIKNKIEQRSLYGCVE